MFDKIISSPPFTERDANEYLEHINGDGVIFGEKGTEDKTMVATARALLGCRLEEGERFSFTYRNRGYSRQTISENRASTVLEAMCGNKTTLNEVGRLWLHEFCLSDDVDIAANLALVKGNFARVFKGWKRDERITAFFANKIEVLCYTNVETKSAYVFTSKLSARGYHYLQCAIPAILPWFFSDKPLDDTEIELMHSLTESTEERYLAILNSMAEKYDFRSLKIKKLLNGFEKREISNRIEATKSVIRDYDQQIKNYNRRIKENLISRNDKLIILAGLESKMSSGEEESELMKYFMANKKVTIDSVTSDKIYFYVKDYLDYFDEEIAKSYINNDNSYMYRDYNSRISADDMKKLMTAIFIDKKLRVKVAAEFCYTIGVELSPVKYADFSGSEFSTYTPNPHLDIYQCLGNSRPIINESIANADSIMVIEQCIAATKNINFGDSTVCCNFMATMYEDSSNGYNTSFIELPDGRVVKPSEAIEYLSQEA